MKKIGLYLDKFWKKTAAVITSMGLLLTGVSQFDKIQELFSVEPDAYVEQINSFIQKSKILKVQVIENPIRDTLKVDYLTFGCPNCDYTSKYTITTNRKFKERIEIEHKDTIRKNQFWLGDGSFYNPDVATEWSGDGIPLPIHLPSGDHDLKITFYFRCSKNQIKHLPIGILTVKFKTK